MRGKAVSRGATATSIVTGAFACAGAAVCIAAATALLTVAVGIGEETRATLGFGFGGVDHTRSQAARIAIHNARYAAGTLVFALTVPRLPRQTRIATDYLLAAVLALNAATVGLAFGAYRWRVIAATAPHLPVEVAGLSLAGGAYLQARTQPLRARSVLAATMGCALLLAVAAVVETYVSMR